MKGQNYFPPLLHAFLSSDLVQFDYLASPSGQGTLRPQTSARLLGGETTGGETARHPVAELWLPEDPGGWTGAGGGCPWGGIQLPVVSEV